ncbi:MAG: hypothetical protein HFH93_09240 [Lachnospiraceae bacterium]|nr:hypothetical protein [Lachnospiraceae bacterium]
MAKQLKWLVIDVDGTMTDGGIYYDEYGNELKKFNTKDAAGIIAARQAGITLVVLTGRTCKATEKRMKELGIELLFQNVKDKKIFLTEFMNENGVLKEQIGYIGDDLNDYLPMQLVEFVGCPANSCIEIKKIATYVSEAKGGEGAVREIITHILRKRFEWDEIINKIYGVGI